MKKFVLATVCAIGLGLAASTGASAVPLASGLDGVNVSSIVKAQTVIIERGRRHPRFCRTVTRCRVGAFGRRVCRTERICRR